MLNVEKRLIVVLIVDWVLYAIAATIAYFRYPISFKSPVTLILLLLLYVAIGSVHIIYLIYLLNAPNTMLVKILTWIMTVSNLGYTLPLAISTQQEHGIPYKRKIGWCNILLGWTIIGWFVTLYFSIVKFKRAKI